MHGMGDGREQGRKDAAGRQRLLGVGAVAEQRDGWRRDDGPHGGLAEGEGEGEGGGVACSGRLAIDSLQIGAVVGSVPKNQDGGYGGRNGRDNHHG